MKLAVNKGSTDDIFVDKLLVKKEESIDEIYNEDFD
jgi:hypothetical protein